MVKRLVVGAACLFSSCASDGGTSDTKVIVEINMSVAALSSSRAGYVVPRIVHPQKVHVAFDDPPDFWRQVSFSSLSDRAGPTFQVVVRGYEAVTFDQSSSDLDVFWSDSRKEDREVARVGLRTGFVTGETRFVQILPTYGCLQSMDSVPDVEPKRLGGAISPLVLDGCSEESEANDAGVDASTEDADPEP